MRRSAQREAAELLDTATSVRMNDAERLSTLQNIEKQTLEEERKIARISQVINQYERLKRALR